MTAGDNLNFRRSYKAKGILWVGEKYCNLSFESVLGSIIDYNNDAKI